MLPTDFGLPVAAASDHDRAKPTAELERNEPWLQGATVYPDPSMATLDYPWGGIVLPDDALFPASYTPGLWDDGIFHPNSAIGFGGGDVAPFLPGSRFRVFDH